MLRPTLLLLLLSVGSTTVVAAEVARLDSNGGGCPTTGSAEADVAENKGETADEQPEPALGAARQPPGSSAVPNGRQRHSLRWNAFLPGMFR